MWTKYGKCSILTSYLWENDLKTVKLENPHITEGIIEIMHKEAQKSKPKVKVEKAEK
jgi:hypothetical protein